MRILQVAPPWVAVPPRGYGGTEMVVAELSDALTAAGHEVLLFATGDSDDPRRRGWVYPEALGMRGCRPAAELYQALAAREMALAEGVDVIHDHTMAGTVLPSPIPTVFTQHQRFTEESRPLYRIAQEREAKVVAISQSHATEANFAVDAVVHHGLDISRYPLGDGEGGYLAFLGRMSPEKGVHLAIDIARAAGAPLRIAAKMQEQPEFEYFRSEVEPRLGGDIEFIGEVDFAAKVEFLGHAAALLNPIQWSEPFGLIAIEAMACGTPVITTPFGAAPEIVVDGVTGVVRPHEELAQLVDKAMTIPRDACRLHVEEEFSSERMARDYIRVYEEFDT
jgi:glycosyltransferase involved in cell wall biosynthesis